jgi:hypothetical protein
LLAAAVVSLEPAMPLTLLGFALVVAHGSMRFPRVPHLVVLNSDGSWAVPDRGGYNLTLAPGTSWTTWYVELVLSGPKKLRIVLLRDQLGTEDWRALQRAVREHGPRVLQ